MKKIKKIIKYHGWENHLTALIKDDEDKYYIFIAPNTGNPELTSEISKDLYNDQYIFNTFEEHKIVLPILSKKDTFIYYYLISLTDEKEYDRILRVLEVVL